MKPEVSVVFLPTEIESVSLSHSAAVVIDLLRASTSICHALAHGAHDVIPVATPAEALALRGTPDPSAVLLCGERSGLLIDGFDLGNSPSEYSRLRVEDKTLVFCSTNGSAALLAAREARRLAMGGLVNARALVEWLVVEPGPVTLVCSGQLGRFSSEDAACAGYLTARLMAAGFAPGNDAAASALLLAEEASRDWPGFLAATHHGRYLKGLGFGPDLLAAADIDFLDVVPEWNGTRLLSDRKTLAA